MVFAEKYPTKAATVPDTSAKGIVQLGHAWCKNLGPRSPEPINRLEKRIQASSTQCLRHRHLIRLFLNGE
jgi:hypothetical protein